MKKRKKENPLQLDWAIVRVRLAMECATAPSGEKLTTAQSYTLAALAITEGTTPYLEDLMRLTKLSQSTVSRVLVKLEGYTLIKTETDESRPYLPPRRILYWDKIQAGVPKFESKLESKPAEPVQDNTPAAVEIALAPDDPQTSSQSAKSANATTATMSDDARESLNGVVALLHGAFPGKTSLGRTFERDLLECSTLTGGMGNFQNFLVTVMRNETPSGLKLMETLRISPNICGYFLSAIKKGMYERYKPAIKAAYDAWAATQEDDPFVDDHSDAEEDHNKALRAEDAAQRVSSKKEPEW